MDHGHRHRKRVVQIAAVAQGVALVTFPAASTIFTSASDYDLSRSAYGAMFVPQAIAAVAASILGASWARTVGVRKIYLIGLTANVAAMTLLVVARPCNTTSRSPTRSCSLATASLGVGFGFTVPALNTFTAAFNPTKVDSSVLVLNALLGVGTALAPLLVAVFVGLDFWWGLPVLAGIVLAGILAVSLRLPSRSPPRRQPGGTGDAPPFPRASGCSPPSPCATGSARR